SARARAGRAPRPAAAALARAGSLPALRESLAPGLLFISMKDAAGAATYEQMPLFALFGRQRAYTTVYGGYAYLVPVAPLLALAYARRASARAPAPLPPARATPRALLTLSHARCGSELAPAAAICFAMGLELASDALVARAPIPPWVAQALALGAGALLLVSSVAPRVRGVPHALAALRRAQRPGDPLAATPTGSLVRFAYMVRRATPETPGWLPPHGA